MERAGKGNLTAEKPYKHYLGQVIKVDVKRDESAGEKALLTCFEWHFTSVVVLPQTHYPRLVLRKR